jgi:hypothetical protein
MSWATRYPLASHDAMGFNAMSLATQSSTSRTDDSKVTRNTKQFILTCLADEDPSISGLTAYFDEKFSHNSPVLDTATHSWDNPAAVDTVASSDDNSGEPSSITEDHHTDSDTSGETANGFESVPETGNTPTAPAGTSSAIQEAVSDTVFTISPVTRDSEQRLQSPTSFCRHHVSGTPF